MDSINNFCSNEGVYLLRLITAMLLGGLVGLERQTRGRSAGLRTNILVCLGSAAVIVVFQKLAHHTDTASFIRLDPARAAAGVITGIGFLGAGTIIQSRDFVRGLTTAASIWVVASIGITVGLGEYFIASTLTLLVLIALYFFHRMPIITDNYCSLSLKWKGNTDLLSEIEQTIKQQKIHIKSKKMLSFPQSHTFEAEINMKMNFMWYENKILKAIAEDDRFERVQWH